MNRFVPVTLKKLVGAKDLTTQIEKQSGKIGANPEESNPEWQKEKVPESEVEIEWSRNIHLIMGSTNLEKEQWQ